MNRWVYFTETADTGKTKRWDVHAVQGDIYLGEIRWYGGWRQYVFYPAISTLWNAECLLDVSQFIGEQMVVRKEERRASLVA
jgi:hypothetical protein